MARNGTHYHVISGYTDCDWNCAETYATKIEAQANVRSYVAICRDEMASVTGSAREGWYEVTSDLGTERIWIERCTRVNCTRGQAASY